MGAGGWVCQGRRLEVAGGDGCDAVESTRRFGRRLGLRRATIVGLVLVLRLPGMGTHRQGPPRRRRTHQPRAYSALVAGPSRAVASIGPAASGLNRLANG